MTTLKKVTTVKFAAHATGGRGLVVISLTLVFSPVVGAGQFLTVISLPIGLVHVALEPEEWKLPHESLLDDSNQGL